MSDPPKIPLGSEATGDRVLPLGNPAAFATPAHLNVSNSNDLAQLSGLAAQLLQDPLAMQRLSDRVLELLQQDMRLQRERNRGYGRRW